VTGFPSIFQILVFSHCQDQYKLFAEVSNRSQFSGSKTKSNWPKLNAMTQAQQLGGGALHFKGRVNQVLLRGFLLWTSSCYKTKMDKKISNAGISKKPKQPFENGIALQSSLGHSQAQNSSMQLSKTPSNSSA